MSHFYGRLQGQARNEVTRLGSKSSGISAHLSGWNVGVHIAGYLDKSSGEDVFLVSFTKGSNNTKRHAAVYVAYDHMAQTYRVETLSGGPKNVQRQLNGVENGY
jgi:hypothetical protein